MSYKMLLVEDSPTMRQLICFSLRAIPGLEIVQAEDGLAGMKKLQSESFDVVTVDINMPLMDGLKLVSLMRQDPKHNNIPVVIITTEGDSETKERARALGVSAFITKPVVSGEVLKTVRTILEGGAPASENPGRENGEHE